MVTELNFYKNHSDVTFIEPYQDYFAEIPFDIAVIRKIIQGLLLHTNDAGLYSYKIPEARKNELNARTVKNILKQIITLHDQPLIHSRPVEQRMIATCRDFSVLACTILRQLGIPARVRYGFCRYYFPQFFHDIVLLEYWNTSSNAWCLVDTRISDIQIAGHGFKVNFDLCNIPTEQFITAAKAWRWSRSQMVKANHFGSGSMREIKGLWYIRNKLMQDLAALNKYEMLLWDCWGYILQNKFAVDPYDQEELAILDQVAEVLDNDNIDIELISSLYQHPNLRADICCH